MLTIFFHQYLITFYPFSPCILSKKSHFLHSHIYIHQKPTPPIPLTPVKKAQQLSIQITESILEQTALKSNNEAETDFLKMTCQRLVNSLSVNLFVLKSNAD